MLAGLGLLAIPGLGPVVAAGWLAATAVGAVAGAATGGVIGALTQAGYRTKTLRFTLKAFVGAGLWSRQSRRCRPGSARCNPESVCGEFADPPGGLAEVRLEGLRSRRESLYRGRSPQGAFTIRHRTLIPRSCGRPASADRPPVGLSRIADDAPHSSPDRFCELATHSPPPIGVAPFRSIYVRYRTDTPATHY